MVLKFRATFDGHNLRPDEPVDLRPNGHYEVTVQPVEPPPAAADRPHVLDRIAALATDMGVTDLAERHKEYALGILKLPENPDEPSGGRVD
jgi:hypothetical protein